MWNAQSHQIWQKSRPVAFNLESDNPLLYWAVIVATTTAGTPMADYADRSLGIGYVGGSLMLFTILTYLLELWRLSLGSVPVNNITPRKAEVFYRLHSVHVQKSRWPSARSWSKPVSVGPSG